MGAAAVRPRAPRAEFEDDVQTRHFDTDHAYSDKRLALSPTGVAWLNEHAR